MKVLYVTGHSADYVQDLTYSGLVKLLGVKNVVDYHWNQKFHIPYKEYPRNLGYTKGSFFPSIFIFLDNLIRPLNISFILF